MNRLYSVCSRYCWRQEIPFIPNFKISRERVRCSTRLSHASILQKVKYTKPLQQVHAQIIVSNLSGNVCLCNRLINQYASQGFTGKARRIFSQIPNKNVVSWTVLVSGLTKNGDYLEAIKVFCEMVVREIRPNEITIATVLPAFGKLGIPLRGKSVHCYWIRFNSGSNVYVETGLVDMYSKFGCISIAKKVFEEMYVRNTASWNAMISGYSENGRGEEALSMYNLMRREGLSGDHLTVMSLVRSEHWQIGCQVHGMIVRNGYVNDHLIKSALMELYIKCDCADNAYCLFVEISKKDLVAWTLMLRGFSRSGDWGRTVEHFNRMMGDNRIRPDSVSLITMLSGCSSSGALQQGRRVHALVVKTGFEADLFVGTAMIDMYANCASVNDAEKHFGLMEKKDVACWNVLISGYGMMGQGNEAMKLFQKMRYLGFNPDESTLVSVLCACSHSGLVTQGLQIFYHMTEAWGIIPSSKHYTCVIDLLGRAGWLNDAYLLMKGMQSPPGPEIYSALLTACRIHRNSELGDKISQELIQLNPSDAGHCVLLSNIYALSGNWDWARMGRILKKSNNLKKNPGLSSLEISGQMFTFMAGQTDHFYYPEVKEFLRGLILEITAAGYKPDTDSVLLDVSDDVKNDILFHHSEKLAIAFGLMWTKPGMSILITKNLRICNDCHSASKFISRVYERVLTIKDANRFHVFQDGVCSCGNWW